MVLIVNQFSLQIEVIHLATDFQNLCLNLDQCRQETHIQKVFFMVSTQVSKFDSHYWATLDIVRKERGNQSMFYNFSLLKCICKKSKHMVLGLCLLKQYLKKLLSETMFSIKIIEHSCPI